MGMKGILCACQAGCFASLASVCGKLAASSESAKVIASYGSITVQQHFGIPLEQFAFEISLAIRCIGVTGIFLCNAIMWVLFTKSMHLCSSTLEATAFNTASNFIFTAFFGVLIFGDNIGFQWFCGSSLMVIGLIVMHRGSQDDSTKHPLEASQPEESKSLDKEKTLNQKEKVS